MGRRAVTGPAPITAVALATWQPPIVIPGTAGLLPPAVLGRVASYRPAAAAPATLPAVVLEVLRVPDVAAGLRPVGAAAMGPGRVAVAVPVTLQCNERQFRSVRLVHRVRPMHSLTFFQLLY